VDHCATGKNYCTGQTGTRLRYLSCSYYGRVGRPVDTFDYAIQAMRDKLDQYPRFRGLPVEVAEFSVLANESGKRLNAGESTEWTASWFAAIADHAYRLNVARIHQWNTTVRETLTPLGVVIQRLERMVGGERLAVDAKGANDLSQCGAIACRKDGRLFALVYAHRTNRTPKTTENVTLRLRDPRMKKGERWRITENVIDESHGVFLHALYADLEAAGVKPLPNAPLYGGDILKTFGPAQDAVTKANWKKYQEMAKPGVLRDNEPLEVGDGEAELKLEMPTHSVRVIELTPGK
ncbi:MAG: hypothetical protein NTW86_16500, partial [Candidatus Sumerlaeota bacterium]|nr:hypothetical protein [Candidatus Sumerlaeota bacterium]